MRAAEFAAKGPFDVDPCVGDLTSDERRAVLLDALSGVALGEHDREVIEWAVRAVGIGQLRVWVSLFGRVRDAGYEDGVQRVLDGIQRRMAATAGDEFDV